MVNYLPLNIADDDSVATILAHVDHSMQYGEDEEPHEPKVRSGALKGKTDFCVGRGSGRGGRRVVCVGTVYIQDLLLIHNHIGTYTWSLRLRRHMGCSLETYPIMGGRRDRYKNVNGKSV